jgi:hypothetical protein
MPFSGILLNGLGQKLSPTPEAKYVEQSKRGSVRIIEEDSDTAIWVGTLEVGRYEET